MTQKGDHQSSHQSSSAINYQAVSAIPQRPSPLTHPRTYSSHPEERYSKQGTGTLGVSKSGKRTPGLLTIQTKSDRQTGTSPNDKRESKPTKGSNNSPPPLHINSITMASSFNQESNNGGEDFRILSFAPPTTVEDVINISQEEAIPPLMNTNLGQTLLQSILIAEHERLHASPPQSPTATEQGRQTPPYPYQRPRGEDDEADINPRDYE